MATFLLIILTVAELILITLVITFFLRLKKSEQLILNLQENQEHLLDRVYRNANLEQELVATFAQRQEQLSTLIPPLEERIATLKKLLNQAEGITRSPQFLREIILNSKKKGQSLEQIALNTGLSLDEIQLILNNIS